ncbi:transporter substrate-binding domain-containing protein [Bradyrhizobium brasilense]|uniref:transporter substrate-binding domain-containing protein n=1 Tax=Bradyrhizobium brasilense TaxID=1419277 RepID=UPI00145733F4|nr:transporter substrate-binding domain-containing protein [Bradyrhizobium brasilense]
MLSVSKLSAVAAILAIAAGFTAPAAGTAQEEPKVLNVQIHTVYPPFESKDTATNEIIGFDPDLVNAMAAKLGVKVN